jgi:DNA-binding NarL/FixJ family response regulator
MPGLSSEQTYHELRKINPQVRVILSSGYTEEEVMGRFIDSPAAGFLQKPYKADALVAKIRRHLM